MDRIQRIVAKNYHPRRPRWALPAFAIAGAIGMVSVALASPNEPEEVEVKVWVDEDGNHTIHTLVDGDQVEFLEDLDGSGVLELLESLGIEGLDELLRICRPGGVPVLTVKNTLWDGGLAGRIAELEGQGVLTRVEETEPYVSMPGETGTVPSRGLVLRRI